MQDRPNASELLEALGEFMQDRAANARDRWERFQFLVAGNSIALLRREFEMEDGFQREEWAGLDELLGPEDVPGTPAALSARLLSRNEELVRRIQQGDFDDDPAEGRLTRHLLDTVLNKVRIASPNERI